MSGRFLLNTAPHHVVTKATYVTLARQLALAHLGESIFANRNAAHQIDTVIIHIVCTLLSKSSAVLSV